MIEKILAVSLAALTLPLGGLGQPVALGHNAPAQTRFLPAVQLAAPANWVRHILGNQPPAQTSERQLDLAGWPEQPPGQSASLVTGWPWPEPQAVVRAFDGPTQPWLAGHRGVDLTGPDFAPVLAPADGNVSYNGWIVDRHVLVINHGDLRSTLEPVISDLVVGSEVQRGQVVGQLAAHEASHCPRCLHWGVRQGSRYLDPLLLVSAHRRAVLWQ